jgi:PST family polysaccharide transporter
MTAPSPRKMSRVMVSAFGWGGSMAGVRMVCSFISIKVTAVYLGPSGLALVAQFSNFVSLFQSMLGQGLMTGIVRLSAEYADDAPRRRRVYATALRMGLVFAGVFALVLLVAAPHVSVWLLTDRKHEWLMAVAGVAVAAAMLTDLLQGALGVTREIGLIGTATIVSTVVGLLIFAPSCYLWGVTGGLWASFVLLVASAMITAATLHIGAKGVRLSDFIGPFDAVECRRLLGFYPMLLINGVLAPLTLIVVRDTLVSLLGLEQAGLWQATWRLSEAYQAAIIASTSLYFMPSLGERMADRPALRLQMLRTLAVATGSTAALALVIGLLRVPMVHTVFSPQFHLVSGLMPMQLMGDVLKMAAWILAMSLVALMRTRLFIAITVMAAVSFAGLTKVLVPSMGLEGVLWAYVCTGALQVSLGLLALRDILVPPPLALIPAQQKGLP